MKLITVSSTAISILIISSFVHAIPPIQQSIYKIQIINSSGASLNVKLANQKNKVNVNMPSIQDGQQTAFTISSSVAFKIQTHLVTKENGNTRKCIITINNNELTSSDDNNCPTWCYGKGDKTTICKISVK